MKQPIERIVAELGMPELLDALSTQVTVSLTDLAGGDNALVAEACRTALAGIPNLVCRDDPARTSGRGYYSGLCFKVHAAFGLAEAPMETSAGGCVDWTERLVGSAKERCFISGLKHRSRGARGRRTQHTVGGAIMIDKVKFDEAIRDLRQQRDELRLQLHLAKAEARDEWNDLEKKWNHLEVRLAAVSKEAKDSAGDVGTALGKVAEELGRAYQRLKKSWQ